MIPRVAEQEEADVIVMGALGDPKRRKTMTLTHEVLLAADVADDARVSETPLVDKGFASVRMIGNGLYATISDLSKGNTTLCNGGFLVGRDAALLVEGFATPAGAAFLKGAPRLVGPAPGKAAPGKPHHLPPPLREAFFGPTGLEGLGA